MPRTYPQRKANPEVRFLEIAEILGIYPRGDKFQAHCPCHEDRQESLSVAYKNNLCLIHCHAGCEYQSLLEHFKNLGVE